MKAPPPPSPSLAAAEEDLTTNEFASSCVQLVSAGEYPGRRNQAWSHHHHLSSPGFQYNGIYLEARFRVPTEH